MVKRCAPLGLVFAAVFACSLLTGCAAGQKIMLKYTPEASSKVGNSQKISVSVQDQRPFVKDKTKSPTYLGHFRSNAGIPWAVSNAGNMTLAGQFEEDLISELNALGFSAVTSGAAKTLKVEIIDYNFDAYNNGKFWYKLNVLVLDSSGATLVQTSLKETKIIAGCSGWIDQFAAFKEEMPKLHAQIIRKIVRDNEKVLSALRD